ncbi:16S rRNA m(2)G 1207 methyltransferase [Verrucomicrobium sp. GAS474]|nr:16S rRNA m(2)G 1207 methyltransferase [Verrucomicrobium sp. GAS474]
MIAIALAYALEQTAAPRGRTLWLYGEPLPDYAPADVYHPRKNFAEALQKKGHRVVSDVAEIGRDYDAVFVTCPQQHEEVEGLLALALDRSRGFVMAVAPNDAGGTRLRGMLEAFGVPVESVGKSHCRVAWTGAAPEADRQKVEAAQLHLALRPLVLGGREWWTVPGIFGWDQLDPGSRLLMDHLPDDISGRVADFGCGFGYLSARLARDHQGIRQIDAFDIDQRAVTCCARNNGEKVNAVWDDLRSRKVEAIYNTVVMNPPFHSGKGTDLGLGQLFIQKAWESLRPRGRLFLVANQHLAYEKVVPGLTLVKLGGAYKILTTRAEG